jgi:hypothetical protein
MTTIGRLVLVAALLLPAYATAQSIRVSSLAREDRVLVSFELAEVYDAELRAAIDSGLPTSITYDVDLRRSTMLWVDRLVATARVTASVQFDNLTRRYQLTVMQDGRTELSTVTDDEALVRAALTRFQKLPLFSTSVLEANSEYYVRVRAQTRPHTSLFALPWGRGGVLGSTKFTFLPR